MKDKKFIPTECGWVSNRTKPVNHNNVVVLLWLKNETHYQEIIGFYEKKQWHIDHVDDTDYEVIGWFPIPYTPDNH